MNSKASNFITRTLTGLVYVALLVGSILGGPLWAFFFFSALGAATVWEFCSLMNRHYGASLVPHIQALAGLVLGGGIWLQLVGGKNSTAMFALYALLMLYVFVSELYRRAADPIRNWALAAMAQLYVALPFALMPMLCIFFDEAAGRPLYVAVYPLALFIFLWVNDTGAYLCGTTLSRYFPTRLFPRISPGKSWVGSIGGGLLTLAASVAVWYFSQPSFTLPQWLGFALVVVVFGTWGDLVESLIKRHIGVKDSGTILPGHGGMLDRLDSALLSIPATVAYLLMVG